MENRFEILGVHDENVLTVNDYDTAGRLIKENNVARVRMFVGENTYDEDFYLPALPAAIPQTVEVYRYFLTKTIEKRMTELEAQNV